MKNTTILGRAVFILVMATASEVSATRIDYSSFTLTNGMTVLLSRDSSVPVVAVSMLVGVGSRNEQPGRTGFAHLFEHMMFEGSQHVPKGKFERILESVGGRYNAFTKENFTFYFELMPSAALETALWLDADRIKALNVNHEAVKNQISVVGEEKRMRVDNEPYGFLYYAGISSHSFENWHNSHSIIGSFEDLEAATLTDVQSFHRAYYSPDNITMALVGDFDPVDARHLVEKYFGSIPNHPRPAVPDLTEPAPTKEKTVTLTDEHAKLPLLAVSWRGMPLRGTTDYRAMVLIGKALTIGKSSMLYQALVKRGEMAISVDGSFGHTSSDWGESKGPGTLAGFVIHKKQEDRRRLRDEITHAVDLLQNKGLPGGELERIKIKFRSDWVREQETALGRAQILTRYAFNDGDASFAEKDLTGYMAITNDDIMTAAQKYLRPEAAVWFELSPRIAQ